MTHSLTVEHPERMGRTIPSHHPGDWRASQHFRNLTGRIGFGECADPSDPKSSTAPSWIKADADEQKVWGFVPGTRILREIAGPEVQYYKNGISDENDAIGAIGLWSYLPSEFATSSDATFAGHGNNRDQNIKIDRERFMASETYKNQGGKEIKAQLDLATVDGSLQRKI